jgi:hypothetical protein
VTKINGANGFVHDFLGGTFLDSLSLKVLQVICQRTTLQIFHEKYDSSVWQLKDVEEANNIRMIQFLQDQCFLKDFGNFICLVHIRLD